jgi:hypothetical protein
MDWATGIRRSIGSTPEIYEAGDHRGSRQVDGGRDAPRRAGGGDRRRKARRPGRGGTTCRLPRNWLAGVWRSGGARRRFVRLVRSRLNELGPRASGHRRRRGKKQTRSSRRARAAMTMPEIEVRRPPSPIGSAGSGARPPADRDCMDCGSKGGMKLQNVVHRQPINIPLLYVCEECGITLTVPPHEPAAG